MNATTALTPVVVPTNKGTLLPVFTGAEMAAALTAYRELQHALDAAMPDQIINLDGSRSARRATDAWVVSQLD